MDPGAVEFVRSALKLKDTLRAGWLRAGIARDAGAPSGKPSGAVPLNPLSKAESVADHTFGVALLVLATLDERPELDRARALELAIVHDLAEAATGDLVPGEYAHRGEKIANERAALEVMVESAPLALRRRVLDRFEEYASAASAEAQLVRELDKLEMAFQAERYAMQGASTDALASFHESAAAGVHDARLRDVLPKLRRTGQDR